MYIKLFLNLCSPYEVYLGAAVLRQAASGYLCRGIREGVFPYSASTGCGKKIERVRRLGERQTRSGVLFLKCKFNAILS